jgi:hypothetical protein
MFVVEPELVEVGGRAVSFKVDRRFNASIGRVNSHTAARSAPSPPGSASRSLRSIRWEPRALVRMTQAGLSTNAT